MDHVLASYTMSVDTLVAIIWNIQGITVLPSESKLTFESKDFLTLIMICNPLKLNSL
jgi:hypothetical protein